MLLDTTRLAAFVATALVILVVPGPAVLYIVARSVDRGRMAGIVSTMGVGLGSMLHVLAAAIGVSALLAGSAGGWLRRHLGFLSAQRYFSAGVFIALGVALAASDPGRN